VALLDFIKNRNQQPSEAPEQKNETYKQSKTNEAELERANARPVDQGMSPRQEALMADARQQWRNATQQPEKSSTASPAPADEAANPQPMAQKMENQDKASPALSPTTMQAGARESEKEAPAPSAESQQKSQERTPTIARPTPSWER